jgi:sucrose-6-phosphate hydrolase SacC (GH32 family)
LLLQTWTRVRPIFTPHDPFNRTTGIQPATQYQCDGSLSFPDGIGPVVMWTPDCDVGRITPPHHNASGTHVQLGSGHDLPRAGVAFPRDTDDELLLDFVMEPELIDFGSSIPGGDPGRAWKSHKGDYWNCIFQINSNNLSNWSIPSTMQVPGSSGRYTSTGPKLHTWVLADERFVRVIDASGKDTGKTIAGIGAPMFYPLPNADPNGPDHIITSNEGEVWAVGKYDPATETMLVYENRTAERIVSGVNYLFSATGQAADEGRLLQAAWLWQGNWGFRNCTQAMQGTFGTGFSLVRDLKWDSQAEKLIGAPVPELAKLRTQQLVHETSRPLVAGELWTLPIKGSAGSAAEIEISVPILSGASSVGIAALAPAASTHGALQLFINIGAPLANGSRAASLSVTNDYAPPYRNHTVETVSRFLVLPEDRSVEVRAFIDRIVVEATANGGRGAVIAVEYRPDPQSTVHVFAAQDVKVNVSVWGMGCGYKANLNSSDA